MKKIKNLLISKKFMISVGVLILIYIVVVFAFKSYLVSYTDHGIKINVPDLIDKNELQVEAIVKHLGLKYEIAEVIYDPSKPEGTIIGQDPQPTKQTGIFVKKGRIIHIKTSKKTQLVEVPQCVDKSQRFAERILTSRGFRCKVEYKPSVEAAGAVLEQLYLGRKVKEKEKLKIGSTITLIVGKYGGDAFLLPDLTDLTICDAKNRLYGRDDIQLMVICDNCLSSEDTCQAFIFSQSPEYIEGTFIPTGSTITVHASR